MRRKKDANGTAALGLSEPADAPIEIEQRQTEPDFFQRLLQLAPEDWQNGHTVYTYRTFPVIDKRDTQHYLCKVSESFDPDYLLRNFGSGKYYLQLNNGRGEKIAAKTVSLHNPDFPPRVAPQEVVASDPRNKVYFEVWGTKSPPAPAAEASAGNGDSAAVRELAQLATKVIEQRERPATAPETPQSDIAGKLVDWALSETTKERDSSDPSRIAALIRELKSLMPAPQQPQPSAPDPLASLDRAVDLLKKFEPAAPATTLDPLASLDRAVDLLKKLQPTAPATTAPDPLTQIKQTAELVTTLKETFGPDGPAARESQMNGWQEFLKEPITELVQLLKPFASVGAAILHARVSQPPQQKSKTAVAPTPQAQPDTPTPATAPPSTAESQGSPQQPEGDPQMDPQHQIVAQLIRQLVPNMLNHFRHDWKGGSFASYVMDGVYIVNGMEVPGETILTTARSIIGPDGFIEILKANPAIWAQIAPATQPDAEQRFRQFVDDFLTWTPDADDEDKDDEAAADSPVVREKKSTNQAT